MKKNFNRRFFLFSRWFLRLFWGKQTIKNEKNLQDGAVYVSHHQNMYGPLTMLLWFPKPIRIWAFHPFCDQKSCFRHYMDYTLTKRLGWNKFFAALAGYPLSCIVAACCQGANAIPVYHDAKRSIRTFRQSLKGLQNGEGILIFPDVDYQSNSAEMGSLYKGFLSLDKYYCKATGSHVPFIPIYANKAKNEINIGEPVYFADGKDYDSEVDRISTCIRNQINHMAKEHSADSDFFQPKNTHNNTGHTIN